MSPQPTPVAPPRRLPRDVYATPACVGMSDLFDAAPDTDLHEADEKPRDRRYRHKAARELCLGCPLLQMCPGTPGEGVVAGMCTCCEAYLGRVS